MARLTGLDNWILPDNHSPETLTIRVVAHASTDIDSLRLIDKPKQRIKQARTDRKKALMALIEQFSIENFEIVGSYNGIAFDSTLALAEQMKNIPGIESIRVLQVYAGQKQDEPTPRFFCLKVLFIVQFEGYMKGMQLTNEQFVLIKATSFDEAQQRIKPYIEAHEKPYINSDGEWVRWKFDRVVDHNDFTPSTNNDFVTEGVEVFSEFKRHRMKPEDFWDGTW